jgi:hypothetical protein
VKLGWLGCTVMLAACNLGEITVAIPEDIVVAEVILRGDARFQTAYLHRTTSDYGNARVFDADIVVRERGGDVVLVYAVASDTVCVGELADRLPTNRGTCYAATAPPAGIRPGQRYDLTIDLPEGRRITGTTAVPDSFSIVQPRGLVRRPDGVPVCVLRPETSFELAWTVSAGARAYIAEARSLGLPSALRRAGYDVPQFKGDAVRLLGVSVGAADTTIAFPGGFGLFDRFDEEAHPVLVAIRNGMPQGVTNEIAIAAVDRNYVNWVRGGNFNPSGQVRLPSVAGDGTGVFGSMLVRRQIVNIGVDPQPTCGEE